MKTRRLLGIVLVLLLASMSCGDDSLDPIRSTPIDDDPYANLTRKDHVLFNLQKAYVERNLERYDELLDSGFVFHFSISDFKNGAVSVESWDRASEIGSAQNIFDPNFSEPGLDPVSEIDLTLIHTEGDTAWAPVTPADTLAYPGETWYEKTVRYNMIVTSGQINYTGLNIQASFLIRRADVGGKAIWRIISWRDDTENGFAPRRGAGTASPAVEECTWGKVKTLYSN